MEILAADWKRMTEAAKAASLRAYCPYSHFPVGAAVLSPDGRIHAGCNVENASFGLTVCAERNAVFSAITQGVTQISALVVFTPTSTATAPCGACRQVLNEFGAAAKVRCVCHGPDVIEYAMADLLPSAFGPLNLAAFRQN